VLLLHEGLSAIFACEVHDLADTSRVVFKIFSDVVDLVVENDPAALF
jgi:hypothetical protein